MSDNRGDGFFQEVDVIDVIRDIGTRSKVTQAKILQKLEEVIEDPEDFQEVRKYLLDEINNLTRSFVKSTFGNIEFLIK